MSEIKKLQKENFELRKKLEVAQKWMRRSIKEEIKKISKRKINKLSSKTRKCFLNENIEELITKKINKYFGEMILMNLPQPVINNIVSAEINYYNLKQNTSSDGISVISSYHKAIDSIIESNITKGYRKFSKKLGQIHLRKNDPLEKSLHSVVNKGFIMSLGRLYHLIKLIKNNEKLFDYSETFKKYLDKYKNISDIIIKDDFFLIFDKIIVSEVLGKKRHSGRIEFEETTKIRKLLIGNFESKTSLLYLLAKISEVDF